MTKYKLIKEYPGSPKLGTINGETAITQPLYIVENQPEFWEKVIEKDYEILELALLSSDKHRIVNMIGNTSGYIESLLNCNGNKIHSVKRLSNGEIFTIGDKAKTTGSYPHIITSIEIRQKSINRKEKSGIDRIWLNWELNAGGNWLETSEKVKKPLFTTEDGVDIFEGDEFYFIAGTNKHIDSSYGTLIASQSAKAHCALARFSTKEKAEEYILYNKPCLSLNDCLNIKNIWYQNTKSLEETLENKVKNKLNK